MNLKQSNKINPLFSMSSMTDIIFLLLVFFMLTASFVTPSGNDDGLVVLHCDKDVPVEKLVNVAGIATSLEAKVTIATTPKK